MLPPTSRCLADESLPLFLCARIRICFGSLPLKIYLISGLGADERVFRMLDFRNWSVVHIHWLEPLSGTESLRHYVERLSGQIDRGQEVVPVGVSFGGMIAQELARVVPCHRVIILSSVKSEAEYSFQLRLLRVARLYALVPASWLKKWGLWFADYFFGTETSEEADLLKTIIRETPEKFMAWAIGVIMHWENPHPLPGLIHLHGTHNRIFSARSIQGYIPVEGDGHLMLLNRASQISEQIHQAIMSSKDRDGS